MAKILYCGDCAVQTGFGRVAENILPILAKEHEVVVLAVNYWGDPHDMPFRLYPAMPGGSDPFGSHRLPEILHKEKPDLVLAVNDIWILNNLWAVAKPHQADLGFKWYGYFPTDSYGFFPEVFEACKEWDGMGTYTKFGLEEVRKAGCEMPCDVVPHGIDRSMFFPMDQNECRKELGLAEDLFVVFNGNRNQPRKRIDLTIKGFIQFALDKPDARLWLHMGKKDQGWDLIPLFKRMSRDYGFDSAGKLILTSQDFDVTRCLPVERLNMVYNAADIGVNTCIGEGWGLVNFEHAATNTAQVVPDHTSLAEIFDSIPRIPIESWSVDQNYGLDRGQPSPEGLAQILTHYYENRDDLQKVADWCGSKLAQDQYSWEVIGDAFLTIVNRTLEGPRKGGEGFGKKLIKVGGDKLFPGTPCSDIDLSDGANVFCITLEDDSRREAFVKQAMKMDQKFVFWLGVDGRNKTREEMETLAGRPIEWDMPGNRDALSLPTEAGLAIASVNLWQHAYDNDFPYVAVMEDDTKLIHALCMPVPDDADLVMFNDRSFSNDKGELWGMVCGTDGYLVTRSGMEKLLKIYERLWMPVDLQWIPQVESLRAFGHPLCEYYDDSLPSLKAYCLPAYVRHGAFESTIREGK